MLLNSIPTTCIFCNLNFSCAQDHRIFQVNVLSVLFQISSHGGSRRQVSVFFIWLTVFSDSLRERIEPAIFVVNTANQYDVRIIMAPCDVTTFGILPSARPVL